MIGIFEQEGLEIPTSAVGYLPKYLGLDARRGPRFQVPGKTFTVLRNQYDAEAMIDHLGAELSDGDPMKLFVVKVDLYVPRTSFVFGFADQLKKIAIVSLFRLAGDRLEDRLGKEFVHETGHLMGLRHCPDRSCVMSLSHKIEDTDAKKPSLCENCRRKIENL